MSVLLACQSTYTDFIRNNWKTREIDMGYFNNEEFFAIIETNINHQPVSLISPSFISPGTYRSKVYNEHNHCAQLSNVQDQEIQLIDGYYLPDADNINRYLFQLIIFVCKNLKSDLHHAGIQNHREETYSSLGIKNNQYCRNTHSYGESSIHLLTRGLINKMDQGEIDWGLIYYFTKNEKTLETGIHIELLHPECCCTFFIPVKCSKGIFTTLRIKARDIKHIKTYFNYSNQFKQSHFQYQRISSSELLEQELKKSLSAVNGLYEIKLLVKRWLRNWRFILEP